MNLRHQLIIGYRSVKKGGLFSFLIISGLAVGYAAFLLLNHYVQFEKTFESFLEAPENLYRVTLKKFVGGEEVLHSAENYPAAGPALVESLPEVIGSARLYNLGYKNNVIISTQPDQGEPIAIKHRNFLYADSSFLPLMGYPMAAGDARTALAEPFNAVISEEYAKIYFGNDNPIGQFIRMQDDDRNDELCKVTGVFKTLPENTHLKFDVLYSYETLYARKSGGQDRYDRSWERNDMYTYIRLREGANPNLVEKKIPIALASFLNPSASNTTDSLSLQAINDIHLKSHLAEESEINSDEGMVSTLSIISFIILIIAWINYINMATSRAMERAREVGIKKVVGAVRPQLIRQFLIESGLMHLFAMLLAIGIILLVKPGFNLVTGYQFDYASIFSTSFWISAVLLWLAGALFSGIYPAFLLSSYAPAQILKGKFGHSQSGNRLRKILVITQYAASLSLIAATLIIYQQMNYMMSQDIGMDTEQILVIERPGIVPKEKEAYNRNIDLFRTAVEAQSSIEGMAASLTVPGKKRAYKLVLKKPGDPDENGVTFRWNSMDYRFVEVFDMEILAGKVFEPSFESEAQGAIVITETGARKLGFSPEEIIGQNLEGVGFGFKPRVIGVINDYNQESLKQYPDPIVFYFTKYGGEFFSLRLKPDQISESIALVRAEWDKYFPGNPFQYFFLDDYFNRLYVNEQRFGGLTLTFAGIAIFLASLGLLALSAYQVKQRSKEIGIRKSLGSSPGQIYSLFLIDFLKLLGISIVIALPVTYLYMKDWVEGFAYNNGVPATAFILAAVAVIFSALLTMSFQLIKAANLDPVKTLRTE